jgi:hypothetical protein
MVAVVPFSGLRGLQNSRNFILNFERCHPRCVCKTNFELWGYLKAMVYQEKLQNMDHVKERIRHACARIISHALKQACMIGRDASVCAVIHISAFCQ